MKTREELRAELSDRREEVDAVRAVLAEARSVVEECATREAKAQGGYDAAATTRAELEADRPDSLHSFYPLFETIAATGRVVDERAYFALRDLLETTSPGGCAAHPGAIFDWLIAAFRQPVAKPERVAAFRRELEGMKRHTTLGRYRAAQASADRAPIPPSESPSP